jgi:hypothetical protein
MDDQMRRGNLTGSQHLDQTLTRGHWITVPGRLPEADQSCLTTRTTTVPSTPSGAH